MVKLKYRMPLLELVTGFYDSLKSISQGFASLDYQILDFEPGNLVKLDILVNGTPNRFFQFDTCKRKC